MTMSLVERYDVILTTSSVGRDFIVAGIRQKEIFV